MYAFLLAVEFLVDARSSPGAENAQDAAQTAMRQIQQGAFADAAQGLRQALAKDSTDVELWNLLGIADTELHRIQQAKNDFERGLSLAPNNISLQENLGLLFYRERDYPNAKTRLARAVELGSTNPAVRFSLAGAQLRTGEPQKAESNLKSIESALGTLAAYWDERGMAESGLDASAAEASFEHAIQLSGDDLTALNGAASAAEQQGNDEKALAYLIKARRAAPNDVSTLEHFGSVCIRRDLGLDALDALKQAHELDPSNNTVLFLLARAHISLSNWQDAKELLAELVKRVPNYAPAYYALGWVDKHLSETEQARRELLKALELNPKLSGARYELADLELADGNVTKASDDLEQVLKQDPRNAKANLALGQILMRRGDLGRAKIVFEAAITQDAHLAAAHYNLAVILFRQHEMERAKAENAIAAKLSSASNQASKTQLKLVVPEFEQNGTK